MKIAIRRAVTEGHFSPSATSCVEFLDGKFSEKNNPSFSYFIKEIYTETLQKKRKDAKFTDYGKVSGSAKYRVVIFSPDGAVKAAPYLCCCSECLVDLGSCSLFMEFNLQSIQLNKTYLRSNTMDPQQPFAEDEVVED